jgi:uncharacterized MAPEG superfamily protein
MTTTTAAQTVTMPFTVAWLTRTRLFLMGLMGLGMALGGGLIFALLGAFAGLEGADVATRLTNTLVVACLPAAVVLLHVCGCFRLFDTDHAMDPLAGGESRRLKINGRALQNTVEQAIIFLPPLLALGLLADGESWRWVPALAVTWSVGRVLFTVGYLVNVAWRSPGMVMTLTASIVTFGAVGWSVL